MRIQFVLRHAGALRMFDSTIRSLASSGHEVSLLFNLGGDRIGHELTGLLAADHPEIPAEHAPIATGIRAKVVGLVSAAIDWMRYRDPRYRSAPKLAARADGRIAKFAPGALRVLAIVARVLGWRPALRILERLLRAMPPDQGIVDFLKARPCDLLVVSPLVDFGSEQVEYMLAAKSLGRRTALLVHSWDNLTNKGLIRILPDRVLVWNEAQKGEAVDMHGASPDAVAITGAQCYDVWYAMEPSTTRESFCEKVGLDPTRPYVLFTGSSAFIGADLEPALVQEMRAALTAARGSGDSIQVLVRPHPQNAAPWEALADVTGMAVYPRGGVLPVAAADQRDYFDSIHHSAAVVGVNTSAMIEASILDRPVLTVLDSRFRDTQQGTLHFHHLLNGGHLLTAGDVGQLAEMLARAASGDLDYRAGARRFLDAFIRPYGSSRAGTPVVVEELLELCSRPEPAPTPKSTGRLMALAFLALMRPVAVVLGRNVKSKKRRGNARVKHAKSMTLAIQKAGTESAGAALAKEIKATSDAQSARKPWKDVSGATEFFSSAVKSQERELVKRLRKRCSGKRVIIGPWLSEVGFEILYWVPFVRWMEEVKIFDPKQAVLVSRGGRKSGTPDSSMKRSISSPCTAFRNLRAATTTASWQLVARSTLSRGFSTTRSSSAFKSGWGKSARSSTHGKCTDSSSPCFPAETVGGRRWNWAGGSCGTRPSWRRHSPNLMPGSRANMWRQSSISDHLSRTRRKIGAMSRNCLRS